MNVVEAGLYTKLTGNSNLTTELGGSYVYNPDAPQGQARPYVIAVHSGGGHLNITPSDIQHHRYLVKAVADEPKRAGTIDGLIVSALHQQTLTVAGYTNYATWAEDEVQYTEVARDDTIIYHRGHYYRIRIDA